MSDSYRLDWTDGWLCVVYSLNSFSEPTRISHWWPIAAMSESDAKRDYQMGWALINRSGDLFETVEVYPRRPIIFRLKDGGSTKPIRTDTEPIPAPKTARQTRWQYGKWEKYLKSKGWVPA